ncbi:diphosphate--fructose-6-phosphate 1-phosphotransferase [Simkania negevensis]|uniref:Pyrophosphate--fructose 6-phosphate 1-phosphotransferase n=1 Tax=Simkania negevensis TaxID=83561 RepID=A0ABS3AQ37_9BACT|nr:diphosphate--fructose-6-phosphate 1-phosphotransferase [Simkania negevensis]
MTTKSALQQARLYYHSKLPMILRDLGHIACVKGDATSSIADADKLQALFPKTFGQPIIALHHKEQRTKAHEKCIGVLFSGGQAAGGHNVICGLFDAIKSFNPKSSLVGFVNGPKGVVDNDIITITQELVDRYRNQGGFDMIGSSRTKIESEEQLKAALDTAIALDLDGIVIIGGDDSNTNAAVLAEFFRQNSCKTCIIGVPKTIDGDLKNEQVELSFGFDTATRIYSELIGNIAQDCLSAKKYYHFIKVMGRSASHIALECALQTHPNYTLIGEEVAAGGKGLKELVCDLSDLVVSRAEKGKNYGIVLIPEGLIEFIPEIGQLIRELNRILTKEGIGDKSFNETKNSAVGALSAESKEAFDALPPNIQEQLLLDRDPHGNVKVAQIETEKLLIQLVREELKVRKKKGSYKGSFHPLPHYFGYEGRAALPSNFDAQYCYALGKTAAVLINAKATGYMSCLNNLAKPIENWQAGGVPLTMMMNIEERHGKEKPVIKKALVNLNKEPFVTFAKQRQQWQNEDHYLSPGPIQFFGPDDITYTTTHTLG